MSLRRSLVVAISIILTLLAVAAAANAYVSALREASDLLDLQQRQIARFVGDDKSLAAGDLQPKGHRRVQLRVAREHQHVGRPRYSDEEQSTLLLAS